MLLLPLLMIGSVVGYDHRVNYWQAFAPGKLLQRLDAITDTDIQPDQAAALAAQLPGAQAKLDEDVDDVEETDDETEVDSAELEIAPDAADDVAYELDDDVETHADSHSAEGHSGEDYERNYEHFVRQYFNRIPDNTAELDESIESQAEASNVQHQRKPKQKQRCQRVQRKGQLCKICREPRNNEVTETCSYSHEAQPEQYAFDSGTQYRRYRDVPREQQQQPQPQSKLQSMPRHRRNEIHNKRHTTILQPAGDSHCKRRLAGSTVCYECLDSGGQRLRRCYDAATESRTQSTSSDKPLAKQSQQLQREQRIYKRTVSYSYEQGSSQDEVPTTAAPAAASLSAAAGVNSTVISSGPSSYTAAQSTAEPRARRLAKVVRRRLTAPAAAA